ncbi:hypothetical protein OTU49_007727, partial [Cherax quadricarinatus]
LILPADNHPGVTHCLTTTAVPSLTRPPTQHDPLNLWDQPTQIPTHPQPTHTPIPPMDPIQRPLAPPRTRPGGSMALYVPPNGGDIRRRQNREFDFNQALKDNYEVWLPLPKGTPGIGDPLGPQVGCSKEGHSMKDMMAGFGTDPPRHPPVVQFPQKTAFQGDFNLGVHFPGQSPKLVVNTEQDGSLRLNTERDYPITMVIDHLSDHKTTLRLLLVYSKDCEASQPVHPCKNHQDPVHPKHMLVVKGVDGSEWMEDPHPSILVTPSPTHHPHQYSIQLRFLCRNSCITRKDLTLILQLEKDCVVVGRLSMSVKVSACPKRDSGIHHRKPLQQQDLPVKLQQQDPSFTFCGPPIPPEPLQDHPSTHSGPPIPSQLVQDHSSSFSGPPKPQEPVQNHPSTLFEPPILTEPVQNHPSTLSGPSISQEPGQDHYGPPQQTLEHSRRLRSPPGGSRSPKGPTCKRTKTQTKPANPNVNDIGEAGMDEVDAVLRQDEARTDDADAVLREDEARTDDADAVLRQDETMMDDADADLRDAATAGRNAAYLTLMEKTFRKKHPEEHKKVEEEFTRKWNYLHVHHPANPTSN